MVNLLSYRNDEHRHTLQHIHFTVQDVNAKALKYVPHVDVNTQHDIPPHDRYGTTVQLYSSKKVTHPVHNRTMDVITGFEVIDTDCVILCVEGLADKGMKFLESRVQKPAPKSETYPRLLKIFFLLLLLGISSSRTTI